MLDDLAEVANLLERRVEGRREADCLAVNHHLAPRGSRRAQAEREAAAEGRKLAPRDAITLRQRAWPLVEMMKRSSAAGADIVWGV